MAKQGLVHYAAYCHQCERSCEAKNAQAWAHQHVNRTGHAVELQLGWLVTKDKDG